MGRAVAGHEVAIVDANGTVLPAGTIGSIAVRRPDPVMSLAVAIPDETDGEVRGDWLLTGDNGRIDDDGYFWFRPRRRRDHERRLSHRSG